MPEAMEFLVVVDFPGIKEYVFAAERLIEIRGASGLLDMLNRHWIPDLITQRLGIDKVKCVFSGGGAGQYIIRANPDLIASAMRDAQGRVFRDSGGGLRFIWGSAPLAKNYSKTLGAAFLDLERAKDDQPFLPTSTLHAGFFRECESCAETATALSEYAGTVRPLCEACRKKEEHGRQHGPWNGFADYLQKRGLDRNQTQAWRPDDFGDIGARCQSKTGYTALVYADGNGMGRIVRKIQSREQFEHFSRSVDMAIREACYDALSLCCHQVNGKIPADILLLGGDDLLVYLSADMALSFAVTAARRFQEHSRNRLAEYTADDFFRKQIGENGLTISLGIAFAKSHTPISIMIDQAEELLRLAKRKGAETARGDGGNGTASFIDFHFTNRFNHVSVAGSRRHYLTKKSPNGEKLRFSQGPYALNEAEALWNHAAGIAKSGIPQSRLQRLGNAPLLGKINAMVETRQLCGRIRDKRQLQILSCAMKRFGCEDNMPWRNLESGSDTVIMDLMNLAEFVSAREE